MKLHNAFQPDGDTIIKTSAVKPFGAVRELQRHGVGSRLERSHAVRPHHVSSHMVRSNDRARAALSTFMLGSPIELTQHKVKRVRALLHTPHWNPDYRYVRPTSFTIESNFRSWYPIPTVPGFHGLIASLRWPKHLVVCIILVHRIRLRRSSCFANSLRGTPFHLVTDMHCCLR